MMNQKESLEALIRTIKTFQELGEWPDSQLDQLSLRSDEIGVLAKNLVDMGHSLKNKHTGLESQLAEQTKKLEETKQKLSNERQERLISDKELALANERLNLGVETASLGVWDWELAPNELTWNDKLFELYDIPKQSPVPYEAWRKCVHPDDLEEAEGILQKIIATNRPNSVEFRIHAQNGDIRNIICAGTPLSNKEGKVVRVIGSNIEVTEQRNYEAKIKLAKEQAETANQAKSDFLANMSHEIRTPMNAVLGFAEILKGLETDPEKKRLIDSIYSAGKALLNLINDILDLSKVEAGKMSLQYSAVSLQSLFTELETIFSQKVTDKGLKISTSLDPQIPQALILDGTRLRQVLINLISNALKFTDKGYIHLSVECHFPEKTHSQVDLSLKVQDSGIGIPPDQVDKIFEAFEQIKRQKVKDYGGTGLGLAISKKLITMMNGTIHAESVLAKGATFIIHLPTVEVAVDEALNNSKDLTIDYELLTFEKASILIVDDIDYNRIILQTFLADFGFDFYEAADGKEALAQIHALQPDLVLLDMKMPGMNGYDVSRELNKDSKLKGIAVVAVTASALTHDEEIISKLCDGYLRKPVSKAELINEVMKHLKHELKEQKEVIPTPLEQDAPALTENQLKELIKLCKEKIQPFVDSMIENPGSFNDMMKLHDYLQKVVQNFPDPRFITWQQNYSEACQSFDIKQVKNSIQNWPSLIVELQVHT